MSTPPRTPDIYIYSDPKKNAMPKKVGKSKGNRKGGGKYKPTPADKERITRSQKYA